MGKTTTELMLDKHQGKIYKVVCKDCKVKTNHKALVTVDIDAEETFGTGEHEHSIDWNVGYQIIQCQGCDEISFRRENSDSESYVQISENEWDHDINEILYPSRDDGRVEIKDADKLPNKVQRIYEETLRASSVRSKLKQIQLVRSGLQFDLRVIGLQSA